MGAARNEGYLIQHDDAEEGPRAAGLKNATYNLGAEHDGSTREHW
jgi:hypothetical protein